MKYKDRNRALVLLADGTQFFGKAVGVTGSSLEKFASTLE